MALNLDKNDRPIRHGDRTFGKFFLEGITPEQVQVHRWAAAALLACRWTAVRIDSLFRDRLPRSGR